MTDRWYEHENYDLEKQMRDLEEVAQDVAVDIVQNESSFNDFTLVLIGLVIGMVLIVWLKLKGDK